MKSAYQQQLPGPLLQPFVVRYWEFNNDEEPSSLLNGTRLVLPEISIGLIINLESSSWILRGSDWEPTPKALIQGVITRSYLLQARKQTHAFGIHFSPEGLLELFGLPQQELVNQFGELEGVLGGKIQRFVEAIHQAGSFAERVALSEAFLLKRWQQTNFKLPYLSKALQLIRKSDGELSVEQLSSQVYLSRRQLERQFIQYYGLSPKTFLRIRRFYKAARMGLVDSNSWTQVAHTCGYSDQAHLIRDFRELTGQAPTLLHKQSHLIPNL